MGLKVGTEYRTNPLSYSAGGVTIVVERTDGKVLEYNDVKYPNKYIKKIKDNPQNKDKIKDIKIQENE